MTMSSIIRNSNLRAKVGEGIYLLYFALMIGIRALGLYEGMKEYNIVLVIGMVLFICKLVVTQHTKKEYAIIAAFLLLAGIIYVNTGEKGLLVCFTMMLGMKEVSVKRTIETGAIIAGTIVLIKVFMGVFGLVNEIYYPQDRAGIGIMFRHSLGYAHPNTLHMNVLIVSMMLMYLVTRNYRAKKKYDARMVMIWSLLILLFNVYVFQYSGSRTGLLTCIVYLGINYWFYIREKIGVVDKIILFSSFPVVSFVSIALPFLLKGRIYDFFNYSVFNNRFNLALHFWKYNRISLFGIRLNNPADGLITYGIDMAQLYLLLQLGIVAFVLVAGLSFWYVYEGIEYDLRAELAVYMAMLFLGMWEPLLYNLGFKNFVFVFWGAMLYGVLSCGSRFINDNTSVFGTRAAFNYVGRNNESKNRLIMTVFISLMVGIIISVCYISISSKPKALYGNREENEAGFSFGMEPLYLSEAQIKEIEDNGDIVIGYSSIEEPMYRYDETIAIMEYYKKAMSIGVWSAIILMLLLLLYEKHLF